MKKSNGFTLFELLIASAIFLIVMLTVYSAFHTGIFGYKNIEESINTFKTARQILERIDSDLRNSFAYYIDPNNANSLSKFTGKSNEISFMTLVDTYSNGALTSCYAFVSYGLDKSKLTRLCRLNQDSLNEKSKALPEEMSYNIEEINFSYGYIEPISHKLQFKDSWAAPEATDEQKALPVAIKIKLTINGKTKETFERTVFLPLAKLQ